MIALTREPSLRRASTIGLDSSMRRPTELTIRSMICSRWRLSLNTIVGGLEPAVPLDVDLVVPVHEDVGDVRVAQQRLERAEAEQLVQDVDDQALALDEAERGRPRFLPDHLDDQVADLGLGLLARQSVQPLEVQAVEQLLMDAGLQFLIVAIASLCTASG